MNLIDAVRKAWTEDKYFTNERTYEDGLKTKPTDGPDGCILCNLRGEEIAPRWEPSVKEILAENYIVVD